MLHFMKIRLALPILITAITLLPSLNNTLGAEKDSPAAIQMKHIGQGFKTLSSQISDPAKRDSSLQIVEAMQSAVNAARPLVPAPATKLQGDSLKTYMREYSKGSKKPFPRAISQLHRAYSRKSQSSKKPTIPNFGRLTLNDLFPINS